MPALSSQFTFVINTGTFTATSVAIPSTAVSINNDTYFRSNPQKGDGYFGNSDGLHTVSFTVTPNFAGSLSVQASLATSPSESDWFTVTNTTYTYEYPIIPATTTTNYTNFTGNFVWVRAIVERTSDQPNGGVRFVNYNH